MNKPFWKLRNWININKLDKDLLSENINAIDFLKENPDNINWENLSGNTNASELLLYNSDKFFLSSIGKNENLEIINKIIHYFLHLVFHMFNNQKRKSKNIIIDFTFFLEFFKCLKV